MNTPYEPADTGYDAYVDWCLDHNVDWCETNPVEVLHTTIEYLPRLDVIEGEER
jgi:hypothetical protein